MERLIQISGKLIYLKHFILSVYSYSRIRSLFHDAKQKINIIPWQHFFLMIYFILFTSTNLNNTIIFKYVKVFVVKDELDLFCMAA